MKTVFKVGDRVFDIRNGWGTVESANGDCSPYDISVRFDRDELKYYYADGKYYMNDLNLSLSFTEYTFSGFSQERPKKEPEIGSLCLFSDDEEELNENKGRVDILGYINLIGEYPYVITDIQRYKFCKQIKIEEL
jgi:hypothetical protein